MAFALCIALLLSDVLLAVNLGLLLLHCVLRFDRCIEIADDLDLLWSFGVLNTSGRLNSLKIVELFAEILIIFFIILVYAAVRERVMRQHAFSTEWVSLRLSKTTVPVIAR